LFLLGSYVGLREKLSSRAKRDAISDRLLDATGMAAATHRRRGRPRDVSAILKARSLIEECSSQALSLNKVARMVNLNPTYLSERFKQVTGMKFIQYVARIRFKKARDLLENSNLPITQIALVVGFRSHSQFDRVFKTLSGKSAKEYRAVYFEPNRGS
jgi:two-component system response regulator YesN